MCDTCSVMLPSWPPLTDSVLFMVLTAATFALGAWLGWHARGRLRGEGMTGVAGAEGDAVTTREGEGDE